MPNLADFSEMTSPLHSHLIIHEAVFTSFCLIGVFLNILTINMISRFGRTRKIGYFLLANWTLLNCFTLLMTPISYKIIAGLTRFSGYLCLFEKIGIVIHGGEILSVTVLVIGCSLELSKKCCGLAIGSIWVYLAVSVTSVTFSKDGYDFEGISVLANFFLLAVTVLLVQSWRFFQKMLNVDKPARSTLLVDLAAVFVVTWAFGFFNVLELNWIVSQPLVSILLDCVTFSTPVVNFATLYHFDRDFRACFVQMWRRKGYKESVPELPQITLETDRDFVIVNF